MSGWWGVVLALVTTAPATPVPEPVQPASQQQMVFTGGPKVGYVDGHVLRLPGGVTVDLPKRWGVTGIAAYDGGYLVSDDRIFEGTVGMAKLDADGTVLDQWSGTGPPMLSRDGRVAWVSLFVSEAGQQGPTVLHADSVDGGAEVTQRIDRTRVPFLTGWFRGRLVYETWGQGSSFLTDLTGPPQAIPLAEDLGQPSPSGRRYVRPGGSGLEIRQYDGQLVDVVRDRRLTRTQLNSVGWEDEQHLLATYVRGGRMCVVRIEVGGPITRASRWRPASTAGFAFLGR
jgi:hypothetical protein